MILTNQCQICKVNQWTDTKGKVLKWVSVFWAMVIDAVTAEFVFLVGGSSGDHYRSPHEWKQAVLVVWHLLLPDVWVTQCKLRKGAPFNEALGSRWWVGRGHWEDRDRGPSKKLSKVRAGEGFLWSGCSWTTCGFYNWAVHTQGRKRLHFCDSSKQFLIM